MKKMALYLLAAMMMACQGMHEEESNLLFLYNQLSLADRVANDTAYYRAQVASALTARTELPWGTDIPEREFRHFVLPPRVNNEDLDDFRQRYYAELRDRVKDLTMQEAILEVNHWCHEHVTYRPTSARTLGPVSTIRSAYGRCGEESVLLVAALRTVAIPARQVYTPRWAHTDDNHAWVEAWADGQWHFLGACEPEPVLDLGWFNESASRGMLMHTRVFGNYDGPEEVVSREYGLTEINVTDHYAPTTRLRVTVLDSLDRPVPQATVEFKLYNYAEFYTVATKITDEQGRASLSSGHGSLLVWATAPSVSMPSTASAAPTPLLGFRHVSLPSDSIITVHLAPSSKVVSQQLSTGLHLDIVPPSASAALPDVTPEERAANDTRLATEDRIRQAYEATMKDQRSRGNYEGQHSYHKRAAAKHTEEFYAALMELLPDKDLQQIDLDIWSDACEHGIPTTPLSEIEKQYLLNPRIENELLKPYKEVIREHLKASIPLPRNGKEFPETVKALLAWTNDSITVVRNQNPQHLRMRPADVLRSRLADDLGRDIFFVAACRSLGIPARINEIESRVQYYAKERGKWLDVTFENPSDPSSLPQGKESAASSSPSAPKGRLTLSFQPTAFVPDAQYYTHFTLSRLDRSGQLQLLTFPEDATAKNTFASGVELEAGTYVLTTGVRLANGNVLSSLQAISVRPDITTRASFTLRDSRHSVAVIGSLNAENLFQPISPTDVQSLPNPTSILSTTGRGYYVIGLIAPGHEPTNHALQDIAKVGTNLEKWGRKCILLFDSPESAARFNFDEFSQETTDAPHLPSTIVWGADLNGTIRNELVTQLHLTETSLPVFVVADSFNRVVYVSQGYTIGLGHQLLKIIQQL
ncbi:MAG: transglutaminase-like domain-containing protein [Bacteroidales bacterium]|nr:transglutaminase-like domain-containing protein [Bacteroidales bacterium]